jgi:hypothetical protein
VGEDALTPPEFTEQILAFLGAMGLKNVMKPKFMLEVSLNSTGTPTMGYYSDRETVFRFMLRPMEWHVTTSDPTRGSRVEYYANEPTWIASDQLGLFKRKPRVDQIPALLYKAETALGVTFPRVAFVRTNIAGAKKIIPEWVKTL